MLSTATDQAIGLYQRYVSPYKGFCCAYRVHTGRRSCSAHARALVRRLGTVALVRGMPRQLARCKAAYAALVAAGPASGASANGRQRKKSWWEHCDCNPCDCGTCDLPCDCSF